MINSLSELRKIRGLEEHFRKQEKALSLATERRIANNGGNVDSDITAEEERIMDNIVTLCIRYDIDTNFYCSEFQGKSA